MVVALVTGGGGAIGAAICRRLAAAGHDIALTYLKHPEDASTVAAEVERVGRRSLAVGCDLRSASSVRAAVESVRERLGDPLVVVNNAAYRVAKPVRRHSEEEWDQVLRTNLYGPFFVISATLPAMLDAGWGRVVNISSPAGSSPRRGGGSYGASKAALDQLTRVLALEVARKGVTANVVSPGLVESRMTGVIDDADFARILSGTAAGRLVAADEVAAAVAFLCGADAAMVNGQVLAVDGGGLLQEVGRRDSAGSR